MRKLILISFLFINLLFGNLIFGSIPQPINPSPDTVQVIKKLPHQGYLKQTNEDFVYIGVDDDYIFELLKFFPGYLPPLYYKKGGIGAHITLIMPEEYKEKLEGKEIKELGKKFTFQPDGFFTAETNKPGDNKVYLYLKVSSPELQAFRKKYGLSPLSRGHDFHITIGWKNSNKT